MAYFSYNEIYRLINEYNKENHLSLDINKLLYPHIDQITYFGKKKKWAWKHFPPSVLYEDDYYYGVSKPPYWIVNVGGTDPNTWNVHTNINRNLLQVWCYKNLDYSLKDDMDHGYGICNRLDVNTSGIVIVAKDVNSYKYLRKNINEHTKVEKRYLALCPKEIMYDGYVTTKLKCIRQRMKTKCLNSYVGKYSKTHFNSIAHLKDDEDHKYTLFDIRIFTGRTHQIRVHIKMLDTYIVGDPLYGKSIHTYKYEKQLFPRIFLHAYKYEFVRQDNKKIAIIAPLYKDLLQSVKKHLSVYTEEIESKDQLLKLIEHPK